MNILPPVTKNIIIINVLFFFGTVVAQRYGINLNDYLGLHYVTSDKFNLAQLFTYMFMHGGISHIFFNMFAVWMFGRVLEQFWGPYRFILYYIACGVGAGVVQLLVTFVRIRMLGADIPPEMLTAIYREGAGLLEQGMNYSNPIVGQLNVLINTTTVGASGAVYGILLAFGMSFPNQQLFIFPIPIPIKAKFFVIGYAVIELYLGISNNPYDNVAHFAHLGGMIFGFLLITYWRKKKQGNGGYYH